MRQLSLSLLIASGIIASGSLAYAQATPAASTPAIPSSALPTSVPTAPPPAPAEVVRPVKAELIDGTKIEFEADGAVMIVHADGSKSAAPDGMLTLKDQTTFVVKGGKKAVEE